MDFINFQCWCHKMTDRLGVTVILVAPLQFRSNSMSSSSPLVTVLEPVMVLLPFSSSVSAVVSVGSGPVVILASLFLSRT